MTKKMPEMTSFMLHILAMIFMLLDHMWATVIPDNQWMTAVGRLAFPIFAFMVAEGFYYTHNVRKYVLRMLTFAIVSEIPFNLMYGGSWIWPFNQNVMWTFLIAIACMHLIEKVKKKKVWISIPVIALICVSGFLLGTITFVDYHGFGVLTVLVFYLFRGRRWYHYLAQFAGMTAIHWFLIGGQYYDISVFGLSMSIPHQGLALLSLPLIWWYRGKQGPHNKVIQYSFYAFYPVHILILCIVAILKG